MTVGGRNWDGIEKTRWQKPGFVESARRAWQHKLLPRNLFGFSIWSTTLRNASASRPTVTGLKKGASTPLVKIAGREPGTRNLTLHADRTFPPGV